MSSPSPAEEPSPDSETVRASLVTIMPELAGWYESSLHMLDDGSFTFCGVFSECSHFVRDRFRVLSPEQLARLGSFVSACMAVVDSDLDTAAATCFLENLAGDPPADALMPYLSGEAVAYLRGLCS